MIAVITTNGELVAYENQRRKGIAHCLLEYCKDKFKHIQLHDFALDLSPESFEKLEKLYRDVGFLRDYTSARFVWRENL